ncbi:TPA: hypothetical protein MB364_000831 [Klebsiella variicola subsp. variicola]|nr:hypothetical protein [Klebsiella variicola subsp. variicola]
MSSIKTPVALALIVSALGTSVAGAKPATSLPAAPLSFRALQRINQPTFEGVQALHQMESKVAECGIDPFCAIEESLVAASDIFAISGYSLSETFINYWETMKDKKLPGNATEDLLALLLNKEFTELVHGWSQCMTMESCREGLLRRGVVSDDQVGRALPVIQRIYK